MREAREETLESGRPGLVLTAVGPDRPGLVKALASHVRDHQGNIEDTRMTKLGGEFAVLMLITGSETALPKLKESLPALEPALGVSCFVKSTNARSEVEPPGPIYHLRASGIDRAGIVQSVADVVASQGANVTSLTSYLDNAPLTGTPMFHLVIELTLGEGRPVDALESALSDTCGREDLEFTMTQQ